MSNENEDPDPAPPPSKPRLNTALLSMLALACAPPEPYGSSFFPIRARERMDLAPLLGDIVSTPRSHGGTSKSKQGLSRAEYKRRKKQAKKNRRNR